MVGRCRYHSRFNASNRLCKNIATVTIHSAFSKISRKEDVTKRHICKVFGPEMMEGFSFILKIVCVYVCVYVCARTPCD